MSQGMKSLGSREKNMLGLLAILLVVLGWRYIPTIGRGGGGGGPTVAAHRAQDYAGIGVVEPRLAALEAERAEYEPGRNIFRYAPKAPPPPPPVVAPPPTQPRPVVAPPPTAPPPPRGPQPPTLDLELLGTFGPQSRRLAVLRDGEILINALAGDVIDGKFVVDAIDVESVRFKFVGFPDVEPESIVIGE